MSALLRLPELAKYELLEEIGHGGMATVYRARDRRLGREVAIKLIHRHLRDSAEVAERFAREATAVAKLRHGNIVEVFDISDPEEGEQYLVVELVRGMTLRERLRQKGPLPPEVAVAVALEVGAGLEHAHQQGVIHRDVKPENVLMELVPPGEPAPERTGLRIKLTDFGIAKLLDAQGVTSTGQVLGSPAHMAPEQIEGGPVDARTDVFALGVLLYECMVGHLPFQGDHPAQVLRKVLDGEFSPPEREDAKIGAQYSRIVVKALARQREQRFDSVQAFMDALVRELAALGYGRTQPLLEAIVRPDPAFFDDLVARLVERGSQARAEGRIAVASDYFGRALAYRPGDRQLLRRVSGLERHRQLRKLGRWALGAAAACALAVGIFYQVADGLARQEADAKAAQSESARQPLPPDVAKPAVPPAPVKSAIESPPSGRPSGATGSPPLRSGPGRRPSTAPVVVGGPEATRDVVVRITGAMGGTLKIDGEPVEWFGNVRHPLSLGPHRFEFVGPNQTCCRGSERTVVVTAGDEPQEVIGEIRFLDATLRVTAEDGHAGLLTCPTLFAGDERFPGERSVAMSRGTANGTCTLRPETPGALPQKKEVILRAGQPTVIPWP